MLGKETALFQGWSFEMPLNQLDFSCIASLLSREMRQKLRKSFSHTLSHDQFITNEETAVTLTFERES